MYFDANLTLSLNKVTAKDDTVVSKHAVCLNIHKLIRLFARMYLFVFSLFITI
jgi:hypothetical protein